MNYSEFVKSRVKAMPTTREDIHHAATGMMGEVVELIQATTRDNVIEELGDLEFYREAMRLVISENANAASPIIAAANSYQMALHNLVIICGGVLDLTKKMWVYQKPLHAVLPQIDGFLASLEGQLDTIYRVLEAAPSEILAANRAKLLKRYPTGYTDAAAQARADKAGEE